MFTDWPAIEGASERYRKWHIACVVDLYATAPLDARQQTGTTTEAHAQHCSMTPGIISPSKRVIPCFMGLSISWRLNSPDISAVSPRICTYFANWICRCRISCYISSSDSVAFWKSCAYYTHAQSSELLMPSSHSFIDSGSHSPRIVIIIEQPLDKAEAAAWAVVSVTISIFVEHRWNCCVIGKINKTNYK